MKVSGEWISFIVNSSRKIYIYKRRLSFKRLFGYWLWARGLPLHSIIRVSGEQEWCPFDSILSCSWSWNSQFWVCWLLLQFLLLSEEHMVGLVIWFYNTSPLPWFILISCILLLSISILLFLLEPLYLVFRSSSPILSSLGAAQDSVCLCFSGAFLSYREIREILLMICCPTIIVTNSIGRSRWSCK